MRLLCFGETGQVARELALRLPVGWTMETLSRARAPLHAPDQCRLAIEAFTGDAVINAAAWTAVDAAESAEPEATVINGEAPTAMAAACADRGLPLVHLSTDYVFAGTGTAPWRPDDAVDPVNAYGRSKLAGERGITASGATAVVLRTAWVFSPFGSNFVRTMLRLSRERDALRIVADQIGGPTPASAIADACFEIARQLVEDPGKAGTYHFSGRPDVSWAGFARAVFETAGTDVQLEEIASSEFPTPAARPANSRLDCSATDAVFGITRPEWREALVDTLARLEQGTAT